jgi:hypothetical protein
MTPKMQKTLRLFAMVITAIDILYINCSRAVNCM